MKHYLLTYTKKRQYLLFTGDILILLFSIILSYFFKFYLVFGHFILPKVLDRLSPLLSIVILFHIISLYLFNQYDLDYIVNRFRSSCMIVLSVLFAGLGISGALFFLPKYVFGRQVLLIHLVVTSIMIVLWRLFFIEVIIRKAKPKRLAILGNGQIISSFIEEMAHIKNSGFKIKNICISNGSSSKTCSFQRYLFQHKSVFDLIKSNNFDAIAFDSTSGRFTNEEIRQILQAKYDGKGIYDISNLYKNITGKVPLTYIDGRWLLNCDGLQGEINPFYMKTKKIFDIMLSILLLLFTAPMFIIIAAAIKLNSKGNVFFIQERLGLHKKPFNCIKFRTMIKNAELKSGPIWSNDNDPRITGIGRLLRKNRLDELPQLWNILKGEMSFVGPRPIRKYFATQLSSKIPFYGLRFSVKPGLSGWAQVNYDYGGSEEGQIEKFQYELFYIQNLSLFLDILTAFRTAKKMLKGEGT